MRYSSTFTTSAKLHLRNILAHGYDNIDDRIVWGVIEEDLDRLLEDVNELLP